MTLLIFLLALLMSGETQTKTQKEDPREKTLVSFMAQRVKRKPERIRWLAKLFLKNADRWGLDPALVACVSYKESTYRLRPRKIRRCKTVVACGNQVGPCYASQPIKKVCSIINAPEVGLMQILPHDGSTRRGWKFCTGRRRWRRRADLRVPAVNVCIGTYELSQWKAWAQKRGRWWKVLYGSHKRFYRKNPGLRKFHWVAGYNWGPRRRPRFKFKIGYPVRVLRCYRDYLKHSRGLMAQQRPEKQVRGAPR